MTGEAISTDRFRSLLVLLATLGTVAFNVLSATGFLNGVTPQTISAKYPSVLTPAGYAFTIWSLIYVGMIAFAVYQMLPSKLVDFRRVRTGYILSCLLNCAWIYFWQREAIGVCLAIILALLATLTIILISFRDRISGTHALFTKLPFGIYTGWITAAALANLMVFLVYMDVRLSQSSWNIFASAGLAVAVAASVAVRIKLRNFFYPLAVAWAATAIAINQSGNTVVILAAALCVVVCLVLSCSFVLDLPGSSTLNE